MKRLEAQIYDGEHYVRLYEGSRCLADLYLDEATKPQADAALRRFGLTRKTEWQIREWGFAAQVTAK